MRALNREIAGIERLELPQLTRHFVFNPSVVMHQGRLLAVYRGVNYDLRGEGYAPRYCGIWLPVSDTQNYIAEIAADFTVKRVGFLEDRHIRKHSAAEIGVQDLRLFEWQGRLHAVASSIGLEPGGEDGKPVKAATMTLLELRETSLVLKAFLPRRQRREKNWMPWVIGEELHYVYQANPCEVLRHAGSGPPVAVHGAQPVDAMPPLSGGSCVMPCGEKFIAVVHSKSAGPVHSDEGSASLLSYAHRLMVLNADFSIAMIGPEFSFEDERIEYCCGLAIDGDRVILSYGIWDGKAVLVRLGLRDLLEFGGVAEASGFYTNWR